MHSGAADYILAGPLSVLSPDNVAQAVVDHKAKEAAGKLPPSPPSISSLTGPALSSGGGRPRWPSTVCRRLLVHGVWKVQHPPRWV